jgi:hypothetical protein
MYTQTTRQSLTTLLRNINRFTSRSTHAAIVALLALALLASNVSAAVIQTNMTPVKNNFVRQTLVSVKPALNSGVSEVLPKSLATMVSSGIINPATANNYRLIFIEGKAPQGMPEIAHMLSLPKNQQVGYALQKLTEAKLLSSAEAQMLLNLRAVADEQARAQVVATLESGSYGPLATAILQVVADLTSIDPKADLETCEATMSDVAAQGFLGNALKWLGGLVDAVIDGAIKGAFYGMLFGHAEAGAIIGGIGGGIKYIADSTGGNGFMPGPNGEGCTGWPRPFPGF